MRRINKKELGILLKEKQKGKLLDLTTIEMENETLRGYDFSETDLSLAVFRNVDFRDANISKSKVKNTLFFESPLLGASFYQSDMEGATIRDNDMTGVDLRGANLFRAVFEGSNMEHVITDENTLWFRLHCPEKGAFLGYKKCVNDRLVQLLIPADAKRTSATLSSCRCSKAKVLTIKSFDSAVSYEEAWSLVDENFVYRVGEWVEVLNFNEDRFMDSTTGIHFWMTREEAMAY